LVRDELERYPRTLPERWTKMGIFEKLMKKMVDYCAKESGLAWKWQAVDSKSYAARRGEDGQEPHR
jgi:hypothetical protein